MQANLEMHQGRSALRAVIAEFPPISPHWNEAQNRFQFVDRLLDECLGWAKPQIEVERFDDAGGRADYLLGRPVRAALEAKREAKRFNFLPTSKPTAARKLRSLVDACSTLKDACSQVIGYCALHGARLAIVCNGPQMVVFQSVGQGASPLDGECFVFDGFQSYIDEFPMLWRLLSPEGVYENAAVRALAELQNPRIPAKASTALGEAKAYRYRTPFQDTLRTLATILLEDVEYNSDVKSDFYRECYVRTQVADESSLLSNSIVDSRYKRVSENGTAPAIIATKVEDGKISINVEDSLAFRARPLVVVGDVGVGKTSFFENLFEQLDVDDKSRTLYIHVNLGQEAALATDVKSYFLRITPIVLKEEYGINIDSNEFAVKLYSPEMDEFEDSVEGQLKEVDRTAYLKARINRLSDLVADRAMHIVRSLNFIVRAFERQVMIVLDNADQRTFETQQEAFLVAQELVVVA